MHGDTSTPAPNSFLSDVGCHRCTVSTHSVLLIVEFGTDGVFTVFLNGLKVRTPRWCIPCDWLIGCD